MPELRLFPIKFNPNTIVWFGFLAVALGVINCIAQVVIIPSHTACGTYLTTFSTFMGVIAIVLGYCLQNFEERLARLEKQFAKTKGEP